jgi:hypothetical protein
MMLSPDINIGWDVKDGCHKIGRNSAPPGQCPLNFPSFGHIIDYAGDQNLFFADFVRVYTRLISLLPEGYRLYKPCHGCENPQDYIDGVGFPALSSHPTGFIPEELEENFHALANFDPYNGEHQLPGEITAPLTDFPQFHPIPAHAGAALQNLKKATQARTFLELIEQAIVAHWNGIDFAASTGYWTEVKSTVSTRDTEITLSYYPDYKFQQFGFMDYQRYLDGEIESNGLDPFVTLIENLICQKIEKEKIKPNLFSFDSDHTIREALCTYNIVQISIKSGQVVNLASIRDTWSVAFSEAHISDLGSLPKLMSREQSCEFYARDKVYYNECLLRY